MDLLSIIVVLVFLFIVGYLGYVGYRQTRSAADYLVAGRSAHPIVMALSYGATFISTSAIVGFGGVSANFGMSLLWLAFLNIFVGIYIAFVFLGNPTRRMGHHLDAHTFPELLGKRFDSKFIQVYSGLLIFFFMPLYATAVMIGAAEFIQPTFRIPYDAALYIFTFIVAAYVIAGGLKSVMLTDALQGGIMLAGLIVLLIATYAGLGGITAAHQALTDMSARIPPPLVKIGHEGWTSMPRFGWGAPGSPDAAQYNLWWVAISTIVMGVGIGVLAQPQLIVRFMTVKSRQSLNRAVMAGGIFICFVVGTVYVVGPLTNVFFAQKEAIRCHMLDDNAMLLPDPANGGKLRPLAKDAPADEQAKAVRFVSYLLPGEPAEAAPHYVLHTSNAVIERDADGGYEDTIRPGLIAIQRTIGPGTTMAGNQDSVIPRYIAAALPKWFGVVFLLTLLSAAMSTMSSQYHTIGTALGRDVFESVTRRHSEKSVLITRIGIAVAIIAALIAAKWIRGNIIALATSIFFGLCAAAFLPTFIAALFWRRANKSGAIASVLAGSASSLFWLVFMNGKVGGGLGICRALFGRDTLVPGSWSITWNVVDPIIVALPLSTLTLIVVTLLTEPLRRAHVDYCFGGPKPEGEKT